MVMKRHFQISLALLVCGAGPWLRAADSGSQVVVVYNSRVPESLAVARHYAQQRQVPTNHLFGFALSTTEEMSRAEFRDSLQRPLAKALEAGKLWHMASEVVPASSNQPGRVDWRVVTSQIRYAVLCYGVPLRISPDPNLREEGSEKLRPEMRRNEAAVDSELALLPLLEQNLPLAGPFRNAVYTATNSALLDPTNGILLVARLDAPAPDLALRLVDKALEAETNGLWGRAYFDLRNTSDPALKQGDDWIRNAAEICRRLGLETIVDETPDPFPAGFPMSQIAFYAGWYSENVCGPFAQPTVEFMPGAIAYHLHSYSAHSLRSTNRFWAGPLLAKGVTATMGCVDEPYLGGTPDIGIFTARLVYNGMSFGEAAYACQPYLSWQTTVVGDPLYRPYGRIPDVVHMDLQRRHSPWLAWSYLRLVDLNLANGKPLAEVVNLLEQIDLTRTNAVLTEKLADLYAAQGKPSSAVYSYAQALKLNPSPVQALRLRLTLAEKLLTLDRDPEAYQQYQTLLEDYPNYPNKPLIYQKLATLARKLNKPEEARKYESQLPPPAPAATTNQNKTP